MKQEIHAAFAALAVAVLVANPRVALASQPLVVDLVGQSISDQISVQVCAGLLNRNHSDQGVYTLINQPWDSDWLSDLYGASNPSLTSISDIISKCLSSDGVTGYIKYDYDNQKHVAPNLITLAAVMNAALLEDCEEYDSNVECTMVFDSTVEWDGFDDLDASEWMFDHYINDTTTLAFMDPGYDARDYPIKPKLTGQLNPGLIDYIVYAKLYNFYLYDACIPGTKQYEFTIKLVNNNPWEEPIGVMGYNNAWPIAGDIFEAETDCNHFHNMGQIATTGYNNLGFFARDESITQPIKQNDEPLLEFNSSKIYIAFTIGDGDNMSYLKSSRRNWMLDRVSKCTNGEGCFPLLWSISPHTLNLSPLMLKWYYNQAYTTGNDYFVLPPSGHLYAYPSEMKNETQDSFIQHTENECLLLGCNATVEWEFLYWHHAFTHYLPKYAANEIVQGFFTVNVPFLAPVPGFWTDGLEFFKVLSDPNDSSKRVIVFSPREWRGTEGAGPLDKEFYLTPEQLAKVINNHPLGTVSQIYTTSDGGFSLDDLYELVPLLADNVEVVSQRQLVQLALDSVSD